MVGPRSKVPPRVLILLGAAALFIGVVSGVWFLLIQNNEGGIRALIADKKYPEALAAIEGANRVLLPNAATLQKQVETEWLAELREPGPAAGPDVLKKALGELDRFNAALPNHESAQARRSRIEKRLEESVDTELDQLLPARQFDAARALVNRFQDVLADRGKAFQARIREQEAAGPRPPVQPKPPEVATPKTGNAGQLAAALAAAWRPLLADAVVLDACRRALKEAHALADMEPRLDPAQQKSLRAIESLIWAHEMGKDAGRKAVADLIAILRDGPAADDLGRNIWLGLARLDGSKELLEFADLDALPPPPADVQARQAAADVYGHVLERRLRQDGYAWLPTKAEAAKIASWCEQRIGRTSGDVSALYAECLLESGADAPQVNRFALPDSGGWYVAYVRALVKDRSGQHADAADMLTGIVKENAKAIKPAQRSQQALRVLRAAVAGLPRAGGQGKPFAAQSDAGKAGDWLTAVLALADRPAVDDLRDLAFAAVQLDGPATGTTLDLVEKHVTGTLPEADRGRGRAALADAYRLQVDLAATDIGKGRYDEAVAKCARSERYASTWKQHDLEGAAELYGKAVDLDARAAAERAKGDKATARYRAYERAVGKTGDDGSLTDAMLVPTVVAKLAFARSDSPAAYLKQTIAEGQAAVRLAQEQEEARPARRDWWATVRCKGMVNLAYVQARSLSLRNAAGEQITNAAQELQGIRSLLEDARRMRKYKERWSGELAFYIGSVNVALGEKDQAAREFADSLRGIKTMTPPYPRELQAEINDARATIERVLPTLR